MADQGRADRPGAERAADAAVDSPTDHAPVLIARCDADRRYTFVNTPYAARFGLHPREVVGRRVRDVLGGPAYAAVARHVDAALAGERVEFEAELSFGGTGPRVVRCAYDPEVDATGRVVGFVAAIVDLTAARRARAALRESEERFARFMGHLPGLAWIKDGSGRYVYANDAAVAAFGVPRAGLYGRTDETVFPPATARQFREHDRQALAAGAGVRAVETLEHPGGAVRHSLVSKFPIPGPDGQPPLVGGVAVDVTEEMRTRAVLEESEERFRATFDQAAVGIAHVGTDGRWLRVNRKLCDIAGYAPDELMALTFQDVTHPDDVAADLAQLRRLVAGDITTYAMEKRYVRKDRRTVWVNLTVSLVRTPRGEPKYLISVVEDITQKKQAQDALRESEYRLRTLSDNLPDGAVYQTAATPDGGRRFVYVSAGVERVFGVTPAEATADATALYGLVHEGDRDRLAAAEAAALRDQAPFDCEFRSRTRGGGVRWVHCRSAPRRLPTGEAVWEGVVLDVTARKQAEEQLAASRRRLQALFDHSLDAVLLADDDGRYVDANPAACSLLGLDRGDLLGRTVLDITPPRDAGAGRAAWAAFLRDGQQAGEYAVRRPDGTRVVVEYRAVARVQPGLHLSVLRDVTEREQLVRQVRAERERLADVFQQAPSFMCVLAGPEHVFERANDRYLQLVGHRDIVGKPIREALPEIAGQGFFELLDAVYRTGEPYTGSDVRVLVARRPGQPPEERFLDFVYQPFRDPGGAVTGVLVQGVDLTERKQAEEALARLTAESDRQRRLFDAVLSNTTDYNFIFDLGGRLVYANRALLALWGRTADQVVGRTLADLGYPPDAEAQVVGNIRRVADTGRAVRDETRYSGPAPTGHFEYVLAPVLDAGGAVTQVAGSSRDVSDRVRAQAALRASDERRRLALDAAELGAWQVVPAGMTLTTDERFRAIFGVTADRLDYEQAVAVIHPDDRDRVRAAVAAATRPDDPAPYAVEYRVARPDGSVRWVFAKGRANFEPAPTGRTLTSFDGTVMDITDRKLAEERLRRLAADLSEADRKKDEFLATLAHELRNPLAPLRNGLQVMRLSPGDPAAVEKARGMMERQLTQLVRLVDDLLDVSRISRGKLELKRERVPLGAVLGSAIETSRPLIEQMGHDLTVTLPDHTVVLDADLTRMAQVFMNLLNNSAKYMDRGGRIWLTAERQGGDVAVSVRDAGIGIAADQLPRLFEMFSQVDRSLERSQGGLGIGLTLVKRLVEMHGGTIEARSEGLGRGSEFVVRLPVVAEASVPPKVGQRQEEPAPRSSLRILIVDDNRDGADSLAEMLRLMGNDTRTAYDGEEAVAAAADFRPDVVLLDIGLPKLNGYDACRRIREQQGGVPPVIVAQTGWGADEDRQRTTAAGFDHHMVKPVDPSALMRLLAAAQAPGRKGARP